MDLQWYVVRSKPNKEWALWQELLARGLDTFYPHIRICPVNPRSRKIRPYFPGYLFLHSDDASVGASTLRWMPFSSGLVSFDGVPATVPLRLIEAIRRHVETINAAGVLSAGGIQHGDPVTIQAGPFEGYEAIFDAHLSGSERVRVLLKLLDRRQVNVDLPAAHIRKAKP